MSYGVITEQGDLGLGFQEMTEEEETIVKESFERNSEETNTNE